MTEDRDRGYEDLSNTTICCRNCGADLSSIDDPVIDRQTDDETGVTAEFWYCSEQCLIEGGVDIDGS